MAKRSCSAALLLPFLLGSCFLSPVGVRAHAGYIHVTPTGDFGLQDSSASQFLGGIKIDLDDDFEIEDAGSPYLRGDLDFGNLNLVASAFQFEEDGASTLTAPFGDIPAGASVNAELNIRNAKAALTWDIPFVPLVDLSAGIAVDFFDISMDVRATSPVAAFEEVDFQAPVPLLYVRASADLWLVSADLDVGWLSVDLPDVKGNFLDIDVMVSGSPLPGLELFAGYRYIVIDALGEVDGQDFDTDLRLSGFIIGGGVTF